MTGGEVLSIDRLIGRMEQAVRTLETRLPELTASLETERNSRQAECARHWAVTNSLTQTITVERGTREGIALAAESARISIAAEAQTARETLAGEVLVRRQQHHWIIERILQALPVVYGAVVALIGYIVAKGQP